MEAVDLLSSKIGLILCVPGAMHCQESARILLASPKKYAQPERATRRSQREMTLFRKRAVKMGKDTKRPDQKPDQQKVIALTEYVQKLGSVERAKKALDALEQLRRAA